jgi:hypothetical protein
MSMDFTTYQPASGIYMSESINHIRVFNRSAGRPLKVYAYLYAITSDWPAVCDMLNMKHTSKKSYRVCYRCPASSDNFASQMIQLHDIPHIVYKQKLFAKAGELVALKTPQSKIVCALSGIRGPTELSSYVGFDVGRY